MTTRRAHRAARTPPKQLRSRATVEAILDAAIRIFDREGSEAVTTSRIAEVAGVSVGTLYQYFANRDAILDALQGREFDRAAAMMQRVLGATAQTAPSLTPAEFERDVARRVIEGLLELYRAAPELHRVLAVEGLRVTPTERVEAFDLRIVGVIREFLTRLGPRVRRQNLDAAAFVVYQSVRATMLAWMLERPRGLDDRAVVEELTDLMLRYLVSDATGPALTSGT